MSNPLDKEPYSMFKIDMRKEIKRLERKQNEERETIFKIIFIVLSSIIIISLFMLFING
tara:strand:- start:920 stop:1096 length:177 start_codon:yes stop_codon:yes gene_type:complete